MNLHFFVGQDLDAAAALAICLFGVGAWSCASVFNYRWLIRANGTRPFIQIALGTSVVLLLLSISFAFNTMRIEEINGDKYQEFSYFLNRVLVAGSSFGVWHLRRALDKRSYHD
jgi:hypothetical protein